MSGGAWSNDQLNELYIYDAATGALIFQITADGLIYTTGDKRYSLTTAGFYATLVPDNGSAVAIIPKDTYDGVRVILDPPDKPSGGGWTEMGRVYARYTTLSGPDYQPWTAISSPGNSLAETAVIQLNGASTSVTDYISFFTSILLGLRGQEIPQGTVDTFVGTSSNTFASAKQVVIDYSNADFVGSGTVASRLYEVSYTGTVASTAAGDRVGVRIYSNSTNTLAGAPTLLADYGEIAIARASTPQPFRVDYNLHGATGPLYLILAMRRVAGAGTCTGITYQRKLADLGATSYFG